jgi:hypothetical protein
MPHDVGPNTHTDGSGSRSAEAGILFPHARRGFVHDDGSLTICLGHSGDQEVREREIDALIRKGLLKPETRNVAYDVQMALYAFLDATLGAKQ